jgi:hypothetical protein
MASRQDLLPKAVGAEPVACPPTLKVAKIGDREATSKAIERHVLWIPTSRSS